jgi:hypothetical protein
MLITFSYTYVLVAFYISLPQQLVSMKYLSKPTVDV